MSMGNQNYQLDTNSSYRLAFLLVPSDLPRLS